MTDREKAIRGLQECDLNGGRVGNCPYKDEILDMLKEQEDLGTELTNAVELIHKKNERIEKLLKEQEEKAGKWIPVTNGRGGMECSICHDYAPSYQNGTEYLSTYCPNCGAKMEGR